MSLRRVGTLLVAVVGVVVFWPVFSRIGHTASYGDFGVHVNVAREMAATGRLLIAWPVFHLATIAIHSILYHLGALVSFPRAGELVITAAMVITLVGLYEWLASSLGSSLSSGWRASLTLMAVCVSLLIIGPINLFSVVDHDLYLGYLTPTSFHNPTYLVLKPLALLQFALVSGALIPSRVVEPWSRWRWVLTVVSSVLTPLAKPNYAVCLLPALGLLFAYDMISRARRPGSFGLWRRITLGVVLPTVVVLAWQYLSTFGQPDTGLVFAPFRFVDSVSSDILPKTLASLAFPILASIALRPLVGPDRRLQLAWLAAGFAIAYYFLLDESGYRASSGNFGWSVQICLFLLFVILVVQIAEQLRLRTDSSDRLVALLRRLAWPLVAYSIQLSGGLIFFSIYFLGHSDRLWL
jgi:hypothetical protein